MKLRWFDRLVMFIAGVIMLLAAVACIGYAVFERFRSDAVANIMLWGYDRSALWLIAAVGVVLVLFALYFIFRCFVTKKVRLPSNMLVKSTEYGDIRISLNAVDTMVQKSVRTHTQVKECASRIIPSEGGEVVIALNISVMPETIVQELSTAVQKDVTEFVQTHGGILVKQVQVFIESAGINPALRVE